MFANYSLQISYCCFLKCSFTSKKDFGVEEKSAKTDFWR